MRILFLLTYYYPHWTGLTRYAGRIAEGLAARGHEVHALAVRHDPDLPLEEVIGGVRVELGDEVVDGSIASRLEDARRRMAN